MNILKQITKDRNTLHKIFYELNDTEIDYLSL